MFSNLHHKKDCNNVCNLQLNFKLWEWLKLTKKFLVILYSWRNTEQRTGLESFVYRKIHKKERQNSGVAAISFFFECLSLKYSNKLYFLEGRVTAVAKSPFDFWRRFLWFYLFSRLFKIHIWLGVTWWQIPLSAVQPINEKNQKTLTRTNVAIT